VPVFWGMSGWNKAKSILVVPFEWLNKTTVWADLVHCTWAGG
jgi:hypothetical protein